MLIISRPVDIWWLVWGVFVIAIIERDSLLDDSKKWFDLFRVLFELVSAFGGIGLSLGLPTVSLSLCLYLSDCAATSGSDVDSLS
jgi:Trk-type K+ transport system membrane component